MSHYEPEEKNKTTNGHRNGEVAQRVADIVFTAFDVMSGSHGSMNGTHLMYDKYTWQETSEVFLLLCYAS